MTFLRHPLVAVAVAFLLTVPWIGVEPTGTHPGPFVTVLTSGVAVLGASSLLAWGAETAEKDVPRAFAIAVLAVLAVANMTGANRILIGLIEFLLLNVLAIANPEALSHQSLLAFTAIYLVLSVALLVHRRTAVWTLPTPAGAAARASAYRTPHPERAD